MLGKMLGVVGMNSCYALFSSFARSGSASLPKGCGDKKAWGVEEEGSGV